MIILPLTTTTQHSPRAPAHGSQARLNERVYELLAQHGIDPSSIEVKETRPKGSARCVLNTFASSICSPRVVPTSNLPPGAAHLWVSRRVWQATGARGSLSRSLPQRKMSRLPRTPTTYLAGWSTPMPKASPLQRVATASKSRLRNSRLSFSVSSPDSGTRGDATLRCVIAAACPARAYGSLGCRNLFRI